MTERQKKLALLACLLTIVLAILDQNIVSAATVKIVRDLDPVHGLELLPWLVTAYGLAATAALPLYGKLCDVYGAKRVFVAAIAVFLAGSALCGMAQTMAEKLACKADFQKLCPGVKPGDGRPFACLAEHKDKLSPSCAKVIAAHKK